MPGAPVKLMLSAAPAACAVVPVPVNAAVTVRVLLLVAQLSLPCRLRRLGACPPAQP